MFEFLQSVPSRDLIPLLAISGTVVAGILIAVPAIVGRYWVTYDRNRRGAELTAEMLAGGWSPEEIRSTLESTFECHAEGRRLDSMPTDRAEAA
ncbi:hypothetical protein [Alienimonas chondri]|uniref:Uncharacterized protein n=1 Tax=Alienimonas chondri TaxID=2681879 RepID=A0ABX1V8E6_9PLAN|nr:hypothetical protein [Alienimonas chondri]NNJ24433.1 hypothetical protein [Alienimonas chondri]